MSKYRLKVGAARKDVTPLPSMFPFKQADLNGDGQYTYARQAIHLRAVILDNGVKRFLFLVSETECGNLHYIKKYAMEKYGITEDYISFSNTHSHSCPLKAVYDPGTTLEEMNREVKMGEFGPESPVQQNEWDYGKYCFEQSIAAIDDAVANLKPARFGHAEGKSYINISRDELLPNGQYAFGTNPERPSDKTLSVLKFVDENGSMIAGIINYAVHSTMGFSVKDKDGNMAAYGDLAGEIANFVEEAYAIRGEETVVAWTIAAGANQTPVHSFFHTYHPDGSWEPDERYNHYLGEYMWKLSAHMAARQGNDALKVFDSISKLKENIRIDVAERYLKLPATKVTNWGLPQLFDDREIDDSKMHNVDVPNQFVYIGLKLIKIGDLPVFCYEGEMMVEIGMRLKEAAPLKNLVIVTCYQPAVDRDLHDRFHGSHYYVDKWGFENHTPSYGRNPVKDAITEEKVTEAMFDMFDEILNPDI